jgi:transcriptional regulator with XRE-family HTH domain
MDLSMREVATGLGVTITYVSHLEAGRTRPSHDMALRVARLFDADEEEVAVLAGYLPGDIEEILVENPKRALATLRASGGGNAG